MKKYLLSAFLLSVFVLLCGDDAFGQNGPTKQGGNAISSIANGAGKVTVIVVGSAAKAGWEVTKFTGKYVAKPIFVKAAPKIAMFGLKTTGKAIAKGVPLAGKLGFAYLKAKLPL
jgi:hypothetical protein